MKRPLSLATEVAQAMHVLDNELDVPATRRPRHQTASLIDEAKRLQRLQTRRAKIRKELRRVEGEIKHARKMLRALAGKD